eukprot:948883_1
MMGRGGRMVRRGRRRRRRRILGTAVVASSIAHNNARRRQSAYEYDRQQEQLRAQQYEIERLKEEQRRAKEQERIKNQQPKVIYVQAPPPGHTAQHVQKLSGVQQVEYVPQQAPAAKPKIVYVQSNHVPAQQIQPVQVQQAAPVTQLTAQQHNYVQPKPKEKIVYVEKPIEKIVYVDKVKNEQENLIQKEQEPPPPKESDGCCILL